MGTRRRRVTAAAIVLALAVIGAACGGDDDDSAGGTTAPGGTGDVELTDSFRGVTKDAIKVAIPIIDYDCIAQFVDFNRGDQEATYEVFVNDINDNGGVLGRKIEPIYKTYCPIAESEALELCADMTQSDEVFAVIGVFLNASNSGAAQMCVSRDNDTILISHELQQSWIDESPPGLMLTPDISAERRLDAIASLLASEKTLEGKTVGVLTDQDSQARVEDVLVPAFDDMGIEGQGSTAVLTISGTDTSQAQTQLDSFIEKWKDEGVDALILGGPNVANDQFILKVGEAIPGVLMITDQPSGTIGAARKAKEDGIEPNPYANVLSVEGLNSAERFETPSMKRCIDLFEKETGLTVVPSGQEKVVDGHRTELYTALSDACNELTFFSEIAKKVGADLTNDTWTETVNDFGPIELPGTEFASLGEGKYDADDAFRLVQYDEEINDWKGLTPIKNVAG
jgi:hypothetical protein